MNHCLTNNYNWWNSKPKTKWKCKTTAGQLVPVLIINLKSNVKDFWSQFRINIKPTQTSKIAIYPFESFNDSMLLAKFVVYWTYSCIPRHEKNFFNFNMCISICFKSISFPDKNFKWGALIDYDHDEPFMVETAVCPM